MEPILIKYEADTSGIKEVYDNLDRLQNKEQELLKRISDLDKEYNKFLLDYQKGGKIQKQVDEDMAMAMKKHADSQKLISKELENTRKAVANLHARADKLENTVVKGTASTMLTRRLRTLKEELRQMEMAGDTTSQKFIDVSVEAAQLEDQIGDTNAQIRALASDTRNLDAVLGVGQGLTGIMTGATSAMALLGGESEDLQKAFFKVQAMMQVLNSTQAIANTLNKDSVANVVIRNAISKLFTKSQVQETVAVAANTVATGANATAAGAATVATNAWTTALLANPVMWIIAILVGVAAGIYAITKAMGSEEDKLKKINELEKIRIDRMQQVVDRNTQIGEQRNAELERELRLLQSVGASEKTLDAVRLRIAENRKATADKNAKDVQRTIDDLKQNQDEVERLKNLIHQLNEAEQNGTKIQSKKTGEIYDEKDLERFKEQLEKLEAKVKIGIDASEAQKEANNVLDETRNGISKKNAEQARQDAITEAQIRVVEATKGSKEESDARIAVLEAERKKALANVDLSAAERKKINVEADEAIRVEREDFSKQQLADERAGIEAQLALAKEGSLEEFQLRQALMANQLSADMENAKLTANERERIYNDYLKNLEELNKEFNLQSTADQVNTQISILEGKLASVAKGGEDELNLRKQILDKQAELERKNIELTVNDEKLKAAKIKEVDAQLQADRAQLDRDYRAKVIEQSKAMALQEIELEKAKNESIIAGGGLFERMQARLRLKELEISAIEEERKAIEDEHKAGITSEEEYQKGLLEIKTQYAQMEAGMYQEFNTMRQDLMQASYDLAKSFIDSLYQSQVEALQLQLEEFEKYYTTDEEAAKENSNLKLISEEEYARRKEEIENQIKEAEKRGKRAQILGSAAQSTAEVLAKAAEIKATAALLASNPLTALFAPIALAQLGITLAQIPIIAAQTALQLSQLNKYAKGRKGGKGEMAWVGERGPELMWIPAGASIIPNHKSLSMSPDVMREFNIPMPQLPVMPNFTVNTTEMKRNSQALQGVNIDYERIGQVIADKMPKVEQLNVSMDEGGFTKYLRGRNGVTRIVNVRYRR